MPVNVNDELAVKLKTGVEKINDQHKKIFDFTNDLFAHCVGDDEEENRYFGEVIAGAIDLVIAHFKTEENLMFETKYTFYEYGEHKREHDEFIMTLEEYAIRFHGTGSIDLLAFASYAKWWVIGHIKRFDKRYVQYFNRITEGKSIEQMKV